MLHVYGFERIGVAVSDLYFVNPDPEPGQEGAEHGVRLEVRLLEKQPLDGSIYASRPILVGRPVWRADLLESVAGKPGSHDRTHHHPTMRGWEPGKRKFERGLSADPLGWLESRLSDLDTLLDEAEISRDEAHPSDAAQLKAAAPEIVATARRLLERVRAGELAVAPDETPESARMSWL
ncbi:MAG TPA: hypothetical protein VFJ21_02210 [Mycobacteriales bacterium]|jgi:hypothetical protein|nr:hypothetical protein [Mycobacteriales bacterium]